MVSICLFACLPMWPLPMYESEQQTSARALNSKCGVALVLVMEKLGYFFFFYQEPVFKKKLKFSELYWWASRNTCFCRTGVWKADFQKANPIVLLTSVIKSEVYSHKLEWNRSVLDSLGWKHLARTDQTWPVEDIAQKITQSSLDPGICVVRRAPFLLFPFHQICEGL